MTESASRSSDNDPRFLAPVREGQTVAGKYVIGRTLGVGGMGMVYAARDPRLDRQVAIKVLLPRLVSSQTATQRFMREARAATRITSEHVVKLLEIDTLPDGTPLLVMEYLEGRDLRAVLREDGPLAPRLAIDYLLQALQAVAEGHMQTIVHRDLKPSNLFLTTRADGTPLIKVLDFGIAKTLEPEPTDTFALTSSEDVRLGSPTYMPPEQLQNPRDVDTRADIWALGVTLHELISGRPPFQGQTYAELLSKILTAPPDSLKSRISELALPAGLSEIVAKCLEKKREHRYSNAAELAMALAPFGSDDARLSMHRVTGLTRGPSTPHPSSGPPTIVGDSLGTCETTLPVPVEPELERQSSITSSSSRLVPLGSPRHRPALFLGALGLVAATVAFIPRHHSLPIAAALDTPKALAPNLSAVHPSEEQPNHPSGVVAPPVMSSALRADKLVGQSKKTTAEPANPRRTQAPRNEPAPAAASASATQPTQELDASATGPSLLIESLITRRH
jgi:serine/threonine protein kinase